MSNIPNGRTYQIRNANSVIVFAVQQLRDTRGNWMSPNLMAYVTLFSSSEEVRWAAEKLQEAADILEAWQYDCDTGNRQV